VTTNGTPAENLARLKIFGSEVYTEIQGPLKKLESRSKKAIFVGYNMNEYRIWDPNTKKAYTSRDVAFVTEPEILNIQKEIEKEMQLENDFHLPNQQHKGKKEKRKKMKFIMEQRN
jgi:hypothetical protein